MDRDDGIGVTRQISECAAALTYDALPPELVELTKQIVLDTLGVAVGASGLAPEARILADYVEALGGRPESSVLGFGSKAPAPWAAFVNGSLGHMLDYDDVGAGGHVGIATVPVAFAVAEKARIGVSGRDLITAIAAGTDLHTRLDLAVRLPDWTMTEGWFATQLFGFLSGAVTAAKLRGFDAERTEHALGIAFTQVSGSRQMAVGASTDLRSMQAGFSGQGAVLAAELAARGIVGSKEVIEGRYGLYKTYVRNQPDWSALTARSRHPVSAAARTRVQGVAGLRLYAGDQYRDPGAAPAARAQARRRRDDYRDRRHRRDPALVGADRAEAATAAQHRRQIQHSFHDRGHDGPRQRQLARLHRGGPARPGGAGDGGPRRIPAPTPMRSCRSAGNPPCPARRSKSAPGTAASCALPLQLGF